MSLGLEVKVRLRKEVVLHPGGIYEQEQHGGGVVGWADSWLGRERES